MIFFLPGRRTGSKIAPNLKCKCKIASAGTDDTFMKWPTESTKYYQQKKKEKKKDNIQVIKSFIKMFKKYFIRMWFFLESQEI